MTSQLKDLEYRQYELKTQSNRERQQFIEHLHAFKKPLSLADKGIEAYLFFKHNPLFWTGVLTAMVYYKPKLVSHVIGTGLSIIKLLRSTLRIL